MRNFIAALAEFDRDLIRDGVKSGLAARLASSSQAVRRDSAHPDRKAKMVLSQHKQGLSCRLIGRNLGLSKNTVMEIVRWAAS